MWSSAHSLADWSWWSWTLVAVSRALLCSARPPSLTWGRSRGLTNLRPRLPAHSGDISCPRRTRSNCTLHSVSACLETGGRRGPAGAGSLGTDTGHCGHSPPPEPRGWSSPCPLARPTSSSDPDPPPDILQLRNSSWRRSETYPEYGADKSRIILSLKQSWKRDCLLHTSSSRLTLLLLPLLVSASDSSGGGEGDFFVFLFLGLYL